MHDSIGSCLIFHYALQYSVRVPVIPLQYSSPRGGGGGGGGVGQGLFAESAMIMCTGFNCIPCMQKTALSSVLATSAQKRPFYELPPDTVQDVFYVLSLGPHFCHPIPSFDKSTGDGWGLITL